MSGTVPTDGSSAPLRPDPLRPALPERLNRRFVLDELIGRGTCSEVYRARDLLLDREAAVKVFPVADDPRIEREVSLLASLDHPSLVAVYDVGEVDGRAFVVMTLLEGGNLVDRLADGPLPVADTLIAVAAVADGLGHVHRAGVLHRDVTPRNVLFDVDGRAHLSDFGVAFVADAPRITDTGIVVGSASYLAPEQVRGEVVGPPADVYALGLVMIEALTGCPAYTGTPLESAHARLDNRPEMPPGLGADVAALLDAMTADDPDDRPDADDVCVGLRRAALAAETSALAVPVAPTAEVGIACAVPTVGTPGPSHVRVAAAGAGGAAAVGLPTMAGAGPPGASATPAETPGRDPRPLAANARGMVVIGSVVAGILLAGGVVFASTWTVGSATVASSPSATVPPPSSEVAAGAPGIVDGSPASPDRDSSDRDSSDRSSTNRSSTNRGSSEADSGSEDGSEETGATDAGSPARPVGEFRDDRTAGRAIAPAATPAATPTSPTPPPTGTATAPRTLTGTPGAPTSPTTTTTEPTETTETTEPTEPRSTTSTTTTTTTTDDLGTALEAVGGRLGLRP